MLFVVIPSASRSVHGVGLVHVPGRLRTAHLKVPAGEPLHCACTSGKVCSALTLSFRSVKKCLYHTPLKSLKLLRVLYNSYCYNRMVTRLPQKTAGGSLFQNRTSNISDLNSGALLCFLT